MVLVESWQWALVAAAETECAESEHAHDVGLRNERDVAGVKRRELRIARPADRFGHAIHHASRLLDLITASVRMTIPQLSSASACGHSVSRPMPFRKIPRRIITK